MKTKGMSLPQLIDRFHSEEKCRSYLEGLRWPDGVECPRCGSKKISHIKERGQFDCDSCRYQFSVTAGTIFHDSHLPLNKWLLASYIICESKKGVSANQMKRMLGVSYKTAWYLCHRIRAAMKGTAPEPLRGIVEVDETWIGGRHQGVGKGNRVGKTMVVGAIQRSGPVRLRVIKQNDRRTLHGFIREVTHDDAEAIVTDEWPAYQGIGDENTEHRTIYHGAQEWVQANVHTNTIEGVWSLFKRSIVGSYHHLSAKHLDAYLDEMAFRFNNRHNAYLFRDTLLQLLRSTNMPYQALVGNR
jgi:transposase-like protein